MVKKTSKKEALHQQIILDMIDKYQGDLNALGDAHREQVALVEKLDKSIASMQSNIKDITSSVAKEEQHGVVLGKGQNVKNKKMISSVGDRLAMGQEKAKLRTSLIETQQSLKTAANELKAGKDRLDKMNKQSKSIATVDAVIKLNKDMTKYVKSTWKITRWISGAAEKLNIKTIPSAVINYRKARDLEATTTTMLDKVSSSLEERKDMTKYLGDGMSAIKGAEKGSHKKIVAAIQNATKTLATQSPKVKSPPPRPFRK